MSSPDSASPSPPARSCGECSLCCSVLRVDELDKLAGTPCPEILAGGGCGIYQTRPGICRAYRCLWLRGGLEDTDRPDKLGAVVDLVTEGVSTRLSIQEATPGAFDASPRLRAIADAHRESAPVRVVEAGNVLDPDRPFRILLGDGEEQRVRGEWIDVYRYGEKVATKRLPWVERLARRIAVRLRSLRVRNSR